MNSDCACATTLPSALPTRRSTCPALFRHRCRCRVETGRQSCHPRRSRSRAASSATRYSARFPTMASWARNSATSPARPATAGLSIPSTARGSFVRGIPVWATLVGLEYQGEQIAGVVVAPALGHTWRALRGDGAYRGERRHSGFRGRGPEPGDAVLHQSEMVRASRQRRISCGWPPERRISAVTAIFGDTCWWPKVRAN